MESADVDGVVHRLERHLQEVSVLEVQSQLALQVSTPAHQLRSVRVRLNQLVRLLLLRTSLHKTLLLNFHLRLRLIRLNLGRRTRNGGLVVPPAGVVELGESFDQVCKDVGRLVF